MRSLDSKQLGGKNSTSSACNPERYRGNQGSQPGLPNDGKVNPCGLIAWSEFNDTFTASANGISLPIDVSRRLHSCTCAHVDLRMSLHSCLRPLHPRLSRKWT